MSICGAQWRGGSREGVRGGKETRAKEHGARRWRKGCARANSERGDYSHMRREADEPARDVLRDVSCYDFSVLKHHVESHSSPSTCPSISQETSTTSRCVVSKQEQSETWRQEDQVGREKVISKIQRHTIPVGTLNLNTIGKDTDISGVLFICLVKRDKEAEKLCVVSSVLSLLLMRLPACNQTERNGLRGCPTPPCLDPGGCDEFFTTRRFE